MLDISTINQLKISKHKQQHDQQEDQKNVKSSNFFKFENKNAQFWVKVLNPKKRKLEYKFKGYDDPVKFIDDSVLTTLYGIAMQKNALVFNQFRDVLQRLFEAGLTQKYPGMTLFVSDDILDDFSVHERSESQVVLTWNHLYAGFYVWLGAVVISIIAFIGEHIVYRFNQLK